MAGRFSPEDIESIEFSTTRRGYDKEEVDDFLRQLASEVRSRAGEQEKNPYLSLGEEIARLLQHPREAAKKKTPDARHEAGTILSTARGDAEELERDARE